MSTNTTPDREPDAAHGVTTSAREILPLLLAADPYIPEAHDKPGPLTPKREQEIRQAVAVYAEHPAIGFDCCSAHAVADAVPELLAELGRVRAERDAYCDRIDTLTAVAKGNKRHVRAMYEDVLKVQGERDALAKHAEDAEGKLSALAQVRVWRNEDRKGFLFADDVAAALGIREQAGASSAAADAAAVARFVERVTSELSGCCTECDACIDIMRRLATEPRRPLRIDDVETGAGR